MPEGDGGKNIDPAGWPQNRPEADGPGDEPNGGRHARAGDRAAGFVVLDGFERFSQRNDTFSRAMWDDTVKDPAVKDFIEGTRQPVPRKPEGFRQRDFAVRNASWVVANAFADRNGEQDMREGFLDEVQPAQPPAGEKAEIPPPAGMADEIKKICTLFGADIVGICAHDARWVYTKRFSRQSKQEKPNVSLEGMTSVIVMGFEMDQGLVDTAPSALSSASAGKAYSADIGTLAQVAQYIRNLGYQATATMNDTAIAIPYALKAGLGEMGRHNMVITPEFGPRVRFSKIFTDLPLAHDSPKPFGVREFCETCRRCSDACPAKAISSGPPTADILNRSNISGVRKWQVDGEKCYKYWLALKTSCCICMRVCPYNKDFSRWYWRLARRLAATRLRRTMLWLDIKLGFGQWRKPGEWWRG